MSISVADKARAILADINEVLAATPGELKRLEEYLKDPGAGRDAASRSAAAQADHKHLSVLHESFKNVAAVGAVAVLS